MSNFYLPQKEYDNMIGIMTGNPSSKKKNDITSAYVDMPMAEQKPEQQGLVADTIDAVQMGAWKGASDIAHGLGALTGMDWLHDVGDWAAKGADENLATMSDEMKTALNQNAFDGEDQGVRNIRWWAGNLGSLIGQNLDTVLTLGAGKAATFGIKQAGKLILKKEAAEQVGKTAVEQAAKRGIPQKYWNMVGVTAAMSAMSGGSRYGQKRDEVMGMTNEQLAQIPQFSDAYYEIADSEEGKGKTVEQIYDLAKSSFADQVGRAAALNPTAIATDLVTNAVSGLGGGFLGLSSAAKTIKGGLLKGAMVEGGTEAVQGIAEQYALNKAEQDYYNPNKDLTEGMADNAIDGAVLGGVFGSAMGGLDAHSERSSFNKQKRVLLNHIDTGNEAVDSQLRNYVDMLNQGATELSELVSASRVQALNNAGIANARVRQAEENALAQQQAKAKFESDFFGEKTQQDHDVNSTFQADPKLERALELHSILGQFRNNNLSRANEFMDTPMVFDNVQAKKDYVIGRAFDEVRNIAQSYGIDPQDGKAMRQWLEDYAEKAKEYGENQPHFNAPTNNLQSEANIAPTSRDGVIEGVSDEIDVGNGNYQPFQYEVVDATTLSPTQQKDDNQFRDRDRTASQSQINNIARNLDPRKLAASPTMDIGAPLLALDGKTIIAGNGRSMALRQAYQEGGAEGYRQFLKDNADRFGVDSAQLDAVENPVLVRRLTSPVDIAQVAINSNEQGGMRMSELEQAKVDARRLPSMDYFVADEHSEINSTDNQQFIRQFIQNQPENLRNELLDSKGNLSQTGVQRIRNAMLYQAYGDSQTLSRLIENTDQGAKNVLNALTALAPKVAQTQQDINSGVLSDVSISRDIIQAVEKYNQLNEQGYKITDYLAQNDFVGDLTPEAREILTIFDENRRSGKRIAQVLGAYFDQAQMQGNLSQASMFGDVEFDKLGSLQQAKNADEAIRLSLNESANSDFAKAVDDVANGKFSSQIIEVGTTPSVLKMLGLPDANVVISGAVLKKVMLGKHNVTAETLKQLPKQINDPVAVMKSSTQQNGYVVLTELMENVNGINKPVVAALHLKQTSQGIELINIASVYGRNNSQIQRGLENDLLYWNKKKGVNFLDNLTLQLRSPLSETNSTKGYQFARTVGLQLPSSLTSVDNLSVSNVKTEAELSQYLSAKNNQETQINPEIQRAQDILRKNLGKAAEHIEVIAFANPPEDVKNLITSDVEGWFNPKTGKVTLIADSINATKTMSKEERLQFVAWHEMAHRGINVGYKGSYDSLMQEVGKNKAISQIADAIQTQRKNTDDLAATNRAVAIEEAIAEVMAAHETGKWNELESRYGVEIKKGQRQSTKSWLAMTAQRIKEFLSKFFGVERATQFSDEDVLNLIARVKEKAIGKYTEISSVDNGVRYSIYHRRNNNPDSPDNGVGYSMFAEDEYSVEHYGNSHWILPEGNNEKRIYAGSSEFKDVLNGWLNDNKPLLESEFGRSDEEFIDSLIEEANPDDIIDSAGFWDNEKLVRYFSEEVLAPNGWEIVETRDGAISFNDELSINADSTDNLRFSRNEELTKEHYNQAKENGETELTFHQWKQVRSPEFKAWFGDWENDPENASKIVNPKTGEPLVVYHGTNYNFTKFDNSKLSKNTGNDGHYGAGLYLSTSKKEAGFYGRNIIAAFVNIKHPFADNAENLIKTGIAERFGYREVPGMVKTDWLVKKIKDIDPNAGILAELYKKNSRNYEGEYVDIWDDFERLGGNYNGILDLNHVYDWLVDSESDYNKSEIESYFGKIPDEQISRKWVNSNGYKSIPNILQVTDAGVNAISFSRDVQKLGFDGVLSSSEIVAFNPNQIKSATENTGAFSKENDDIRFSRQANNNMDQHYMALAKRYKNGDSSVESELRSLVNDRAQEKGFGKPNYRMQHEAPNSKDEISQSIDNLKGLYPDDLYSSKGYQYYGTGYDAMDRKAWDILKRIKGKPDDTVTIYRAYPKGTGGTITNGDWVTIVRDYAVEHGEANLGGDYQIVSKDVKASEVFTNADSLLEQGYDNGLSEVVNDKKKIKLDELITYDDDGEIIPLSKRFNARKNDIRFSRANTAQSALDLSQTAKAKSEPSLWDDLKAKDYSSFKERFNQVVGKVDEWFADSLRPVNDWIDSMHLEDQTGNTSSRDHEKRRLKDAMYTAKGKRDALNSELEQAYLKPILSKIAALSKETKKSKHPIDELTMKRLVGNWISARYSIEKNIDLLNRDEKVMRDTKRLLDNAKQNGTSVEVRRLNEAYLKAKEQYDNRKSDIYNTDYKNKGNRFKVGVAGGWSIPEAELIMKNTEQRISKSNLESIAEMVYDLNQSRLDIDRASGRYTESEYQEYKSNRHYVPLTGDPNADVDVDIISGAGSNALNIARDKTLKGRTRSEAEDAIDAVWKSIGKSTTYAGFAEFKAKIDDLFETEVTLLKNKGYSDSSSREQATANLGISKRKMQGLTRSSDNVLIRKEGSDYYEYELPTQAMESLRNDNVEHANAFLKVISKPTGWYARGVTQWTVTFAPMNMLRDTWEKSEFIRVQKLYDKNNRLVDSKTMDKIGRDTIKNALADKEVWQATKRLGFGQELRDSVPAERMLKQLLKEGGVSNYGTYLDKSEVDLIKKLRKENNPLASKLEKVGKVLEGYNKMFDTVSALASYKALVDNGIDSKQAAATTLELTNFRKTGSKMRGIKALYMFSQPTVMGAANLMRYLSTRKGQIRFIGYMAVMTSLYTVLRSMDDEDEGGNKMDQLGDITRYIPIPLGEGKYFKIPVGFGMAQMAWNFSTNIVKGAVGDISLTEAGANMLVHSLKTFSPVSPSEISAAKYPMEKIALTVTPTILQPIMQNVVNRSAFGNKITTNYVRDDKLKAEQSKATTAQFWKDVAINLNDTMGIDMHPEQIKNLFDGYSSMLGSLKELSTIFVENPNREALGRKTKMPFISQFIGTTNEFAIQSRYYEASEEAGSVYKEYKSRKERNELGNWLDAEKMKLIKFHEQEESIVKKARSEKANLTRALRSGKISAIAYENGIKRYNKDMSRVQAKMLHKYRIMEGLNTN